MRNTTAARSAKKMQAVRNWTAFAAPNGQVVYRGRYYFAWSRGHFVGAYDSLDDAVESLSFRNAAGNSPERFGNKSGSSNRTGCEFSAM
jgi:hypothetical protein